MNATGVDQLAADWGWITNWTDLLDQDEVWRDANRVFHRLDDMGPDYCARVRNWCLQHAEQAQTQLLWEMAAVPEPSGEVASDCFAREYDVIEDGGGDPQAWLEKFQLLIALKHRAEGLSARPAACHCGYPFADDEDDWDHSACHPGIIVD